jgi:hypothetical protein
VCTVYHTYPVVSQKLHKINTPWVTLLIVCTYTFPSRLRVTPNIKTKKNSFSELQVCGMYVLHKTITFIFIIVLCYRNTTFLLPHIMIWRKWTRYATCYKERCWKDCNRSTHSLRPTSFLQIHLPPGHLTWNTNTQ